jgi:hypothetical protein
LELHLLIFLEFSECKHCSIIGADNDGILDVVTLLEVSSWSFLRSMLGHVGQWRC